MKMIQVRNAPDDLHRALREGTTMSHLILGELPRLACKPSAEEVLTRIQARSAVAGPAGAELVRADLRARARAV